MNKRKIRDIIRLTIALLLSFIYLPHLVLGGNSYVKSDIDKFKEQIELKIRFLAPLLPT